MKKISNALSVIIQTLNDGQYHDGTNIGKALNITRAAVWKAIKKLESYGVKISSVKGKGYALLEPLILLDAKKIKSHLENKNIDIHIFETIHSTNQYLKSLQINNKKMVVCLSEHQSAGKGRFEREWHSPFAENIYFSCAYPFDLDVSQLAGLSLVISLAVLKTLATYGLPQALEVKWPNDILYHHQKICGSLIEIQAESHGHCRAIIGIGVNINMLQDQNNITQAWTSLRQITASYIDRNEFTAIMINHLQQYLEHFKINGIKDFISEWNEVDYLLHQDVTLKTNAHLIKGKSLGIDVQGNLLLQTETGETRSFSSGEASILK